MNEIDLTQVILYEKDPEKKRVTITFNRPEKLNSFTSDMWRETIRRVHEAEDDDEVSVIVFKGAGRCFASGHDVADLGTHHGWSHDPKARRPSQRRRLSWDNTVFQGRRGVCQTVNFCSKVTIAQVHGYCYGGHHYLAMACDITVAAEDALFTHPGYRYIGPIGELVLLMNTMGIKKAKEMTLTGTPLTAQDALACGLVNHVVPMEKLEETVDRIADTIARQPRDAIAMGKAFWELAQDIAGVGASYTAGYITHTLQTNIRYEPDEFNLFAAKKDKGVKGAILEREKRYTDTNLAR